MTNISKDKDEKKKNKENSDSDMSDLKKDIKNKRDLSDINIDEEKIWRL